jgi:ribosomal protein L16 Arg81 hydroxylase
LTDKGEHFWISIGKLGFKEAAAIRDSGARKCFDGSTKGTIMTQMDELEQRIKAALDRIARGVEALDLAPAEVPAPAEPLAESDPGEIAALRDALEDERIANAQLEERVRAIREKQEGDVAGMRAQIAGQTETFARLDTELQRLRRANEMLISTNQEMRRALEGKVGEPHLINKAMLAELESLRASRAADAAENRAVLDTLEPLLIRAANAEGNQKEETV